VVGEIGKLATMSKKPIQPAEVTVTTIYGKRQPRRPHYLAEIMNLKDVDRGALIEDLGVDKGLLSRWLDQNNPSTPGPKWAQRLGRYFASGPEDDDFVDIFVDPAVRRFQRLTSGRDRSEVDRMLATLEAAFPLKQAR
jgi:hypothetical protein